MKRIAWLILTGSLAFEAGAQNWHITFSGTGESTAVDSVTAENLSQCTAVVIGGTDTLILGWETGVFPDPVVSGNSVFVHPNPSTGHFIVEPGSSFVGEVTIRLYDLSGKELLDCREHPEQGRHALEVSGIPAGIHLLQVESAHILCSVRLISTGVECCRPGTQPVVHALPTAGRGNLPGESTEPSPGRPQSVVYLPFSTGDTLKLTARSGNNRTVVMLFPDHDQEVVFPFVGCTDAESNHYAVVQVGSQLWMQENLKTTRYRDGSEIPNVTDSAAWGSLTTGAYCNFHNLPEEGEQYGRLYNFYAVADPRNLCPAGWHVATHGEWNIMEKYLDPTVDTTALMGTGEVIGRILKEGCDTRWQFYDSTYGLNSAGFTALCANFRSASGGWSLAPDNNHDDSFWTSTSYNANMAWSHGLRWCYSDIYVIFPFKRGGFSVRCIRD